MIDHGDGTVTDEQTGLSWQARGCLFRECPAEIENDQLRAQLAQRTAALQKLIKTVEAMPSDHAIPPAWLLLGLALLDRDAP